MSILTTIEQFSHNKNEDEALIYMYHLHTHPTHAQGYAFNEREISSPTEWS